MTVVGKRAEYGFKPFTPEDWSALWQVRWAHLAEYGLPIDTANLPSDPQANSQEHEWDLHHMDAVYLSGAGGFWLAWQTETPLGYVGAQDIGEAIELRRMYVQSGYRRQGIGSALVRQLIAHSQHQEQVHSIELWTQANGPGQQLYQTLGFRVVSASGQEYQDVVSKTGFMPGAEEIRMRLDW